MDTKDVGAQAQEIIELVLDEVEVVSGGFPVVPPPRNQSGG
jgi:hypothetical protein